MCNDTCFNGLSEAERIRQKIQGLRNEKDCLLLAKDIYQYIEQYPERIKAAGIKQITIMPNPCFEAKERVKQE
jgi:hypothetical protein